MDLGLVWGFFLSWKSCYRDGGTSVVLDKMRDDCSECSLKYWYSAALWDAYFQKALPEVAQILCNIRTACVADPEQIMQWPGHLRFQLVKKVLWSVTISFLDLFMYSAFTSAGSTKCSSCVFHSSNNHDAQSSSENILLLSGCIWWWKISQYTWKLSWYILESPSVSAIE